ncbi:hypothetical protein FOQG_16902 [Fusarium oxysporum f. sp. raphani 54005]|uniref:Uncharacterized protein n=2 Tax=Fusarium oxysporum TaxID=5507 RepID=X0C6T0_FUSOX|nr:hypothetical protein FOMG_17346 [Fusarium oxysporum f. sp. melonis 26406]EXK78437.1 hypothetical protein FOQG_16902 [Fusarium oxysporum f. sp. raphani 54005]
MLRALKAGGAFVALDLAHPVGRFIHSISDAGSPVLLMSELQTSMSLVTNEKSSFDVAMWTMRLSLVLESPM